MNKIDCTDEIKLKLATYLENLSLNKELPKYPSSGICLNLGEKLRSYIGFIGHIHIVTYIADIAVNWEHYSGITKYPIKVYCKTSKKAYWELNLWSKTSKYGQHRRELCLLIAKQLRHEVDIASGVEEIKADRSDTI